MKGVYRESGRNLHRSGGIQKGTLLSQIEITGCRAIKRLRYVFKLAPLTLILTNNPNENNDLGFLHSQHSFKIYKVELINYKEK